jgi:hypothetical protein
VIVVLGDRERKKRVNSFIKTAVNTSGDQYARFNSTVCAVSMGFNAEFNRVIEERMRAVTKAAGVKTGKKGCNPNMAIIAMKDSPDFLGELRKKHPTAFGKLSLPARDRLMKGPGPTYAWNTTYEVGAGNAESSSAGGTSSSSSSLDGFGSGGGAKSFSGSNSRINKAIVQDINMAILVIDKTALLDMNLRQIADYSVMRLLANTDEPARQDVSERSILSLFSDRKEGYEAPQSVTAWDLALLKSLYKTKNNISAAAQRSAMSAIFEAELIKIADASETNEGQ